jgi:hypothetical protein
MSGKSSLGDNSHDNKTINMGDRNHFSEYFDEIVESLKVHATARPATKATSIAQYCCEVANINKKAQIRQHLALAGGRPQQATTQAKPKGAHLNRPRHLRLLAFANRAIVPNGDLPSSGPTTKNMQAEQTGGQKRLTLMCTWGMHLPCRSKRCASRTIPPRHCTILTL